MSSKLSGKDSLKIYGYAFSVYFIAAAVILTPIFEKRQVAAQVKEEAARIQQQSADSPKKEEPVIVDEPTRFTINRLGIDFPVIEGVYNTSNQKWTLDNQHIFMSAAADGNMTISNSAEQQKNIAVFYGHNFTKMLGKTDSLVVGDILTIQTRNGYVFKYHYAHDQIVKPDSVAVLNTPNKDESVALITCTGSWNQLRRIMYFKPLGSVQKITSYGSTL